jgi:hypothetical protein
LQFFGVNTHPLTTSQAAVEQASGAVQTFALLTQFPVVVSQAPTWQAFGASQTFGVKMHPLVASHLSTVHLFWSSQASCLMVWTHFPVFSSQESLVQATLSSQLTKAHGPVGIGAGTGAGTGTGTGAGTVLTVHLFLHEATTMFLHHVPMKVGVVVHLLTP